MASYAYRCSLEIDFELSWNGVLQRLLPFLSKEGKNKASEGTFELPFGLFKV